MNSSQPISKAIVVLRKIAELYNLNLIKGKDFLKAIKIYNAYLYLVKEYGEWVSSKDILYYTGLAFDLLLSERTPGYGYKNIHPLDVVFTENRIGIEIHN